MGVESVGVGHRLPENLMPANHCVPHTAEAKQRMSQAKRGVPLPAKRRKPVAIGGIEHFVCTTCKVLKAKQAFYSNKRSPLGIKSECRSCHSATCIRTRDKARTRAAKVVHEAQRRAVIARSPGRVTAADLASLRDILLNRCCKCDSVERLTWDHVTPLSRGGIHHPTNLQLLCRRDNETKQARHAEYRTPAQIDAIAARWPLFAAAKGTP